MANFSEHIEKLVAKEGGYRLIEVKNDRGGRTYAGISYRAHSGWEGWNLIDHGADLTQLKPRVHDLYKRLYWDALKLDEVTSEAKAEAIFSCGVLSGTGTAAGLVQQCLSVRIDRHIGPVTVGALNDADEDLFLATFALSRINRFRMIANRDKSQRGFLRGWVNRVFEEME